MSTRTPADSRPARKTAGSVFALCLAAFLVMIDSTVVQVMLPTLMDDLDAGLDRVLWVINGFTLVYGTLLLPGARLGDMVGPRRLFGVGLALFLAGSALCGLAQSVVVLVAGRIVQAVGGACLIPQTLGLITVVVPQRRRGMAFGFVSAAMALAAIVGPVLGGLLVSYVSWRSAFLVNIPLCLVAGALGLRYLPGGSPRTSHQLDLVGAVLAMAGLGVLSYGFIAGTRHSGGSIGLATLFGGGAVLLVLFVWWERARAEPLMSLDLFRFRSFALALWLGVLQFALMFGLMLIVTLNVQNVLGGSAFQTGLVFLPMAVCAGIASPLAGYCTDRWGGRAVITLGFLAIGAGVAWLALVASAAVTGTSFVGPLALAGLGVGLVMAPISVEAMSHLPAALVNTGTGLLTTGRQLASALGVAIVAAVLQTAGGTFVSAERAALAVLGALALIGVVSARFLPSPAPATTHYASE